MSAAEVFIDTSVLLYLLSAEEAKAGRVEELLVAGGTISVQVLNEFAAVATRKLRMSIADVREVLGTVRAVCEVQPVAAATHPVEGELAAVAQALHRVRMQVEESRDLTRREHRP